MKTATRRSAQEPPHPPAQGGGKPQTPAAAAASNGRLAVVGSVKPEWRLELPTLRGRYNRQVDYPQAVVGKAGKYAYLNVHAMRLLCGIGDVPPPQQLRVRIHADRKNKLVGFSRCAEPDDPAGWVVSKDKRKGADKWRVALGKLFAEEPLDARIARKVIAFGNRIFGFHYGPEPPPAETTH